MQNKFDMDTLIQDLKGVPGLEVIESISERRRFSRDFYDYSPILTEILSSCCADVVVRPFSIEAVICVVSVCKSRMVPLTIRGSGTGNYGQCVPLANGVVMLMSGLNKIREFDKLTGEVTVESGCLIRDVNDYLITNGRQLRLTPSTWRSSSIAGFISGGSGGIGSVRWGFLRDPGHLLGLEVVCADKSQGVLQLDAQSSEGLNHAYGTNGVITALKLSTTSFVNWQEVIIDCSSWPRALEVFRACSIAAIDIYLLTLLEDKIVESLPKWFGLEKCNHRILVLVAPDGLSTIERIASSFGAECNLLGSENLKSGTVLRELAWNHTTLHMRSVDSRWTYLQMLLPQPEMTLINLIKEKWKDDVLWHLEGVRQQGVQRIAALPVVRWRGKEKLEELIQDCSHNGALIFNPHVITVEDGGLGVVDSDQVEAKKRFDPKGILNPGKLKGWSRYERFLN